MLLLVIVCVCVLMFVCFLCSLYVFIFVLFLFFIQICPCSSVVYYDNVVASKWCLYCLIAFPFKFLIKLIQLQQFYSLSLSQSLFAFRICVYVSVIICLFIFNYVFHLLHLKPCTFWVIFFKCSIFRFRNFRIPIYFLNTLCFRFFSLRFF